MISVFIVDDEPVLHRLYRDIFEFNGYRVLAEAYDGEEAVRMFAEMVQKPDIILMDYRMPKMNGMEAMEKILAIDPNVKIIFASADDAIEQLVKEGGASSFVAKPFRIKPLLEMIEQVAAGNGGRSIAGI